MRFWVYGVNVSTAEALDPLAIDADNESEARQQALAQGMRVERIDTSAPAAYIPPHEKDEFDKLRAKVGYYDYQFAQLLIILLRVLAGIVAAVASWKIWADMDVAQSFAIMKQADSTLQLPDVSTRMIASEIVIATATCTVLLALAEALRILIATERHTRREPH